MYYLLFAEGQRYRYGIMKVKESFFIVVSIVLLVGLVLCGLSYAATSINRRRYEYITMEIELSPLHRLASSDLIPFPFL